jgi:predicted dehydrogenase
MADQTIRVGFIGAGKNTRERHIPGFQKCEGVECVAVGNRSRESSERVAKEFGIARAYADWRELLRAPDLDAVCIGTWPSAHREITEAALAAGKHVLCEARMAMNAAEGRSMLAASRKAPHLVAQLVPAPQTLEFDSTIKRLLGERFVGDVLSVDVNAGQGSFVDPSAPLHWRQDVRVSGPNALTMGIWYETLVRWVGPARRVMAMTKIAVERRRDESGAMHEVKIPDHVEILLTLGNGGIAHMRFSSVTALGPASEAWIFGTDGTLRLVAGAVVRPGGPGLARGLSGGRRGDKELAEIPIPAADRLGWRVEEEFVNAIRGREKVTHTTFEDGVRYMEFTDAVVRSAATGQAVEIADL